MPIAISGESLRQSRKLDLLIINALVGSNAVVPNGMVVPTGAMALGVPAKRREGTVGVGEFDEAAASDAARAERNRAELRRVD